MNIRTVLEDLNKYELQVLKAALISSSGNGHDFGFVDEIVAEAMHIDGNELTKQQIGGYIRDLSEKGFFWIAGREKVNDQYWVQQFVFADEYQNELYDNDDEFFSTVEELIVAKEMA